jgi:hypothetical protein
VLANSFENKRIEAWGSSLREKGWIEGKNLIIEYRYAQTPDRFPALAAELVAQARSAPRFDHSTGRRPSISYNEHSDRSRGFV